MPCGEGKKKNIENESYFFLTAGLAGRQLTSALSSSSRFKIEEQLMLTPQRRRVAPLSFFGS